MVLVCGCMQSSVERRGIAVAGGREAVSDKFMPTLSLQRGDITTTQLSQFAFTD